MLCLRASLKSFFSCCNITASSQIGLTAVQRAAEGFAEQSFLALTAAAAAQGAPTLLCPCSCCCTTHKQAHNTHCSRDKDSSARGGHQSPKETLCRRGAASQQLPQQPTPSLITPTHCSCLAGLWGLNELMWVSCDMAKPWHPPALLPVGAGLQGCLSACVNL